MKEKIVSIKELNRKIKEDEFGANIEVGLKIDLEGKTSSTILVDLRGSQERFHLQYYKVWLEAGEEIRARIKMGLVSASSEEIWIDEKNKRIIIKAK